LLSTSVPASPAAADDRCLHCDLPVPRGRRGGSGGAYCCFGCRIAYEVTRAGDAGVEPAGGLQLRLGLGIFLAMNIMVFSGVFYARELFGEAAAPTGGFVDLVALLRYLQMLLATLVLVLLGGPLLLDALDRLRGPAWAGEGGGWSSRVDANLLICIGVVSAFALSVVHTLRGAGSVYFDTAAMILVVVTLGRFLEASARRRASGSARRRLADLPDRAWRRRASALEEVEEVEASALGRGDRVRVRPGEAVAVDGRVTEGRARIDESTLSGESRPRTVEPGDEVHAGTVSLDGQLWVEAKAVGEQRVAARVQQMLEHARSEQPPIQRVVDRVAAFFVPAVAALALGVFVLGAAAGEPTAALWRAMSVLLISCPCALGLAAPLASWHALRRAAERGILVRSAATLERVAGVGRVFFDKTGTLTESVPSLERIDVAPGVERRVALRLAASLETSSLHPLGAAIVKAARESDVAPLAVTDARPLPGIGIEGRVDGRRLRLGSRRLLAGLEEGSAAGLGELREPDEATVVYLLEADRALARFVLTERPRGDAAAAVGTLRAMGLDCRLLSGDRPSAVTRLGLQLGLSAAGGLLPQDKVAALREARLDGTPAAMVGDGINDAPVLAAADVGIAVGSAADLARNAGNVLLIADRLDRVPLILAIARHCKRRIRLNLVWAFAYNSVGIALAAAGRLDPIFAALAMLGSSLSVVLVSRGAGRVFLPARAGAGAPSAGRAEKDAPAGALAAGGPS
jgi:Cu2+-exporting ATPase